MNDMEELLAREEEFWRQKANMQWMTAGEQNTRFFHQSVITRRSRNKIIQLKDDTNSWQQSPILLEDMARQYYLNLYSARAVDECQPSRWNFPPLNHHDKRWLNREVSTREIKQTLFQMDGRKAPGANGIPADFYQKFWHILGESLIEFVQKTFKFGSFPKSMNKTLINLIPKQ